MELKFQRYEHRRLMEEINFDAIFAKIDEIIDLVNDVELGICHLDRDLEVASTKIECLRESKEDIIRLTEIVFGHCASADSE